MKNHLTLNGKAIRISFSQNLYFLKNNEVTHEQVKNLFFFKLFLWVVKQQK